LTAVLLQEDDASLQRRVCENDKTVRRTRRQPMARAGVRAPAQDREVVGYGRRQSVLLFEGKCPTHARHTFTVQADDPCELSEWCCPLRPRCGQPDCILDSLIHWHWHQRLHRRMSISFTKRLARPFPGAEQCLSALFCSRRMTEMFASSVPPAKRSIVRHS